ncbi:Fe-S cluster assembly protein SufD [Acidisoma cellulosilytica]|uniref:Fe-S cluster assembly protein SufD n=1 Tax=Acidisoma cellulosilyticum TaxID=2802395 RepID=A0A964E3U2_9PROT|nr:Fe-S cluster assembly protein SufD [Acidisoma cellulosilyticum]MCB8880592.1 Fe-S cluster assembly protein SufD [Acidisoma cellulosilyticum]
MQAVTQQVAGEALKGFLARYDGLRARLPGNADVRDAAAAVLRERGFPTPKDEPWHFTNLRPITGLDFQEPIGDTQAGADLLSLLPKVEGPRLIFIDGRYRADLSVLPEGLEVRSFAGTGLFGALTKPERDRVVALNTMLTEDGIIIDVPAGFDAGFLMLAQLTSGKHRRVASHPRHRISLGADARLVLLEVSAGIGEYLNNPVIEIAIAEGAHLTHGRLQQDAKDAFHLGTIYADTAANAVYDCFSLALGAKLGRTEIHARLGGEQAAVHLNAAQIMGGNQVSDFTTAISHDAPNCPSRQTVKSVLTGKARAVFQGRIEVARIAQKTDGYQMNQALLLSPDAEINSKPELEIYADDVKCSHGATVGALDPEQLFYLRSRGIPADQARMILVRAFLTDAFEAVAHEGLRDVFEHAVEEWWATTGKDAEAPSA